MVAVSGIGKQIQIIILPDVMTGRWQHIADIDWTLLSVSHTKPPPHYLQYPY